VDAERVLNEIKTLAKAAWKKSDEKSRFLKAQSQARTLYESPMFQAISSILIVTVKSCSKIKRDHADISKF
jgi:hypothetical protein